ncbi:MAG: DUF5069 domain-containing protein [Vampirovibrionales bacterium]|nr:DUF5069 domain-containing protein [Vampirovibrionales bacterium]
MSDAQAPREGSVAVAGLPWLARMIDKARLQAAGEIEQFDLEYPCPMDQSLLRQIQVDSKTFQDIAAAVSSDDEIVKRLVEAGARIK